ncbi:hypothetical protein SRHO_G00170050 [Serrasalmus rhombeus]
MHYDLRGSLIMAATFSSRIRSSVESRPVSLTCRLTPAHVVASILINPLQHYFPRQRKRKEGKSLSAGRKCCHGVSVATLLTLPFLNVRSFWTADLNISTALPASQLASKWDSAFPPSTATVLAPWHPANTLMRS